MGTALPGNLPASFLGAAWAWLLALLIGAALLPRLRRALGGAAVDESLLARVLGWAVVGLPLQSIAWLALGLVGLVRPVPLVVAALVLTGVSGFLARKELSEAASELRERLRGERPGPLAWMPWVAFAGFLLLVLRFAIVPTPYYDDLVYHLGLPQQALMTGSWPTLLEFHHSLMPAGWDAAYLLPLALGGGAGPQLMNVIALAAFAAAAFLLARDVGGSSAAAAGFSMLLLCVAPVTFSLGAFAASDLFPAVALALALRRVLIGSEDRADLVEAGLLAGAAWSVKYTALPAIAGIGLAWLLTRSAPMRSRLLQAIALGLVAIAVASPWTLRALVETGNPLYPAFHSILGGEPWSELGDRLFRRDVHAGALSDRGPMVFVLAAWDFLTRHDELGTPAGLNVVFPFLGIAGVVLAGRMRHRWALLGVIGLCYLGACMTALNLRYVLILMLALLVFVAAMAERWLWRVKVLPAIAFVLVLVSAAFATIQAHDSHLRFYGFDDPTPLDEARADVLPARIHLAAAARDLHERLPPDARILLIAEGRLGLMPRETLASSAYDEPVPGEWLARADSAAKLTELLKAEGFTHVVLNERELTRWAEVFHFEERLPPGGPDLLGRWIRDELQPIGAWGGVRCWEIP